MRQHWLLVRGTGDQPLPERVGPGSLRRHSSTRRPSVQKGDLAVCYASRWQVVFAFVEVCGDPENDPGRERWRWSFPLRPLLVVPDLREAPPVEAAGVFPRSLGRHSYVRLTAEQFEAAREALALARADVARQPLIASSGASTRPPVASQTARPSGGGEPGPGLGPLHDFLRFTLFEKQG